ncbi:hypothetical protein ZHAS_00019202 [Anopheles sinensis]|uniref:Uncharacterized protein n=1 Tax=Anopheles sinensis TaxID=74873 RepID=A0A084WKW5_ANOSI|nr:hypothetical protein ZHAS_00019202 [Anopheles sinensis]
MLLVALVSCRHKVRVASKNHRPPDEPPYCTASASFSFLLNSKSSHGTGVHPLPSIGFERAPSFGVDDKIRWHGKRISNRKPLVFAVLAANKWCRLITLPSDATAARGSYTVKSGLRLLNLHQISSIDEAVCNGIRDG